jgi:hypothetical protein
LLIHQKNPSLVVLAYFCTKLNTSLIEKVVIDNRVKACFSFAGSAIVTLHYYLMQKKGNGYKISGIWEGKKRTALAGGPPNRTNTISQKRAFRKISI